MLSLFTTGVTATGSRHLTRDITIGSQTASCSISLRGFTFWTDDDFGEKSIGSASVANGYGTLSWKLI